MKTLMTRKKAEDKKEASKESAKDVADNKKVVDPLKVDYQLVRALDLLKGWEILKKMGPEKH